MGKRIVVRIRYHGQSWAPCRHQNCDRTEKKAVVCGPAHRKKRKKFQALFTVVV
jgi:ferredoxin-thioredoxin reductase catalytic subunit